jgi:hypothetical protein
VGRETADIADQATEIEKPRRGRKPLPDRELRRVAAVYRDAKARRESVIAEVASEFSISRDAAKKRIRIAKERVPEEFDRKEADDG